MTSQSPLKAHPSPLSTHNYPASGSGNLLKKLKPAEIAPFRSRQPVFSDESSETEYTSASEEAASHENGNCVDSKPNGESHCQVRPVRAPGENLALESMPHVVKSEDVIILSPEVGVLNERTSTKVREVLEEDANGKVRVIIDLGDSDEEMDAPLKETSPLCNNNCHQLEVKKDAEIQEVRTSQVTLVVDLSENPSQVNQAQVAVGGRTMGEMSLNIVTSISSKTSVKQVETKVELVMASQKPHPYCGLSPEVRRVSMEEPQERVLPTAEESEDEASTISANYRSCTGLVEVFPPDWSRGVLCDMCEKGPSLSLGGWYSWCCGKPSRGCECTYEDQQRKKKLLTGKTSKNWKATDPPHPWSGKVHKLCGLWSAEVYQDLEEPWRMMELDSAMQRSRKIKCADPDCGLVGATLGCRVKSCRKTYHYPCADRLSAFAKVRMWDGFVKPIACKDHRHVNDVDNDIKSQKEAKKKKRKRGKKNSFAAPEAGSSRTGKRALGGGSLFEVESSDEEDSPHGSTVIDTPVSGPRPRNAFPQHMGKNLLCTDFSNGLEPILVPCTNDVDDETPPYLEYITKSRYQGYSLGSKKCSQPLPERLAKGCRGCDRYDPDDPFAPLSVHVPFERREDDYREDWLEERMYGRLPYDKHARLVIGTDYNELVECNERCECGEFCMNKEMQKGLRTPIELYKTKNKGWAVRTLVPIPRGKFVIEYVGEMLTQDQAHRYGQLYDEIKRSYLFDLDFPESERTPDFTLDGFHASNVARFINHSCNANLKIYRVYVETTYKWLSHIGMYAMRDIEAGEELSYDYNYGRHELPADDKKRQPHGLENGQEKDSTHIKCYCGAGNCREWLWAPTHTGVDTEDEAER